MNDNKMRLKGTIELSAEDTYTILKDYVAKRFNSVVAVKGISVKYAQPTHDPRESSGFQGCTIVIEQIS